MSKHHGLHKNEGHQNKHLNPEKQKHGADKHAEPADDSMEQAAMACGKMLACVMDVAKKTSCAGDVVFGGMMAGAGKVAGTELHDSSKLMKRMHDVALTGGAAAGFGIASKFFPPVGVITTGLGTYGIIRDTIPQAFKNLPKLGDYWNKAYNESDPHKLNYYKKEVGTKYGASALNFGVDVVAAGIGFGAGRKAGSCMQTFKTRAHGLAKSGEVLKGHDTLEHGTVKAIKALKLDRHLKEKAPGSKVHIDESGTKRTYHPDKSMDVKYPNDGGSYHKSANGIGTMKYPNGDRVTEIPGAFRRTAKLNGDVEIKYHSNGHFETHKPSGTVIKELPNGVVETHRKNGFIYREHPNGTTEVLPKRS